jgi:hypothetical protein
MNPASLTPAPPTPGGDLQLGLAHDTKAPCVGVCWVGATGGTADSLRRGGETPSSLAFVAGLRLWFFWAIKKTGRRKRPSMSPDFPNFPLRRSRLKVSDRIRSCDWAQSDLGSTRVHLDASSSCKRRAIQNGTPRASTEGLTTANRWQATPRKTRRVHLCDHLCC